MTKQVKKVSKAQAKTTKAPAKAKAQAKVVAKAPEAKTTTKVVAPKANVVLPTDASQLTGMNRTALIAYARKIAPGQEHDKMTHCPTRAAGRAYVMKLALAASKRKR